MTTTALKKKIHQYIDSTDDKILKVVHTIPEEHLKLKTKNDFELTEEDLEELDQRWDNYKKGKTKTYTLEEAKQLVNKKLKTIKR